MQTLQAVSVTVGALGFAWVLATMNRIQAGMPDKKGIVSLKQFTSITNLQAIYDLYLKGVAYTPIGNVYAVLGK